MYSTNEIAQYASASLRSLQIWDERGLIKPKQQGHRRMYSVREALQVMIVAELRRKDMVPSKIRVALPAIKKAMSHEARWPSLLLALDPQGKVRSGRDAAAILAALVESVQPMWVIDVGKLLARLPPSPTLDKGGLI